MAGLSEADMAQLKKCFEEMGATPKMDSPEDLEDWMMGYLASQGKVTPKEEKGTEAGEKVPKSADVSRQEATVEKVSYIQPPRVATFSGDETAKGDTTYDLWKFEVDCLREDAIHSVGTLTQAVRKSLKGEAARIVKRLGTGATLATIMQKMDDVYGVVDTGETLLAEFYSARQNKGEDVKAWGCRVEDLLDRVMQHRRVPEEDVNEMLRSVFWKGLIQKFKDSSRHKFDTVTDYDRLRKDIRTIEKEYQITEQSETRRVQVKMVATEAAESDKDSAFKKLENVVTKLSGQVEAMQQQVSGGEPGMGWRGGRGRGSSGGRGGRGAGQGARGGHVAVHQDSNQPTTLGQGEMQDQSGQQFPQYGQGEPFFGFRNQDNQGDQLPQQPQQPRHDAPVGRNCFKCGEFGHFKPDCPRKFEPTCWTCGRIGHRQFNCPDLNFKEPLSRDGR